MTDDRELENRMRAKLGIPHKKRRRELPFSPPPPKPKRFAERRPEASMERFEYHVVEGFMDPPFNEHPTFWWVISKIGYGTCVTFAEGGSEEELKRIVSEVRQAGFRVDEFKLGLVEGPRR